MMTETHAATQRPDLDILEDVEHLIAQYPPARKDQHAIHAAVKNGHVTLSGHVQTPITRRYLLDNIPAIEGVQSVDADKFFDDENIRLGIGKVIPVGVQLARIQYGIVILAGKLPDGTSGDEVAARVSQVTGVARTVTRFQ
jgi:hypothetical protein